jgi:hypothetical protein
MIIAMIAVRMMKVSVDKIINVITMRHRLMSASRAMHVPGLVTGAVVIRRASIGIFRAHLDLMLVHVIVVRMMEMAIMDIVAVVAVTNGRVAAAGAMLMVVIRVLREIATAHLWFLPASFDVGQVTDVAFALRENDECLKTGWIGQRLEHSRPNRGGRTVAICRCGSPMFPMESMIHNSCGRASPIAFRVPLHHARALADHEPAGGLLGDRSRECGAAWRAVAQLDTGTPPLGRTKHSAAPQMPHWCVKRTERTSPCIVPC